MTYTLQLVNGQPVYVELDSRGNVITTPPPGSPAGGGGLDYPPGLGPTIGLVQGMTDGSEVVRPLAQFNNPGGFTDDAAIINDSMARTGGRTRLVGGSYTFHTTVTGYENQYILPAGIGQTIINLATTGIPAFQWTNKNPAALNVKAAGGILDPGLTVIGPGGPAFAASNPSDGSTGAQMADVLRLTCKIQVINCQFGLLSSNEHFWTEQAAFWVQTQGCTNPVVLQTAPAADPNATATRTGSFSRTKVVVFHNDTLNGSFGLGGVQLLAGAQLFEGSLEQYGNFGGTGQAGVYALYISGQAPAGSASSSFSSIDTGALVHGLEYNGTGTAPGTVFVDASCTVAPPARGALRYSHFGGGSLNATASWLFDGPIVASDTVLSTAALGAIVTGGTIATSQCDTVSVNPAGAVTGIIVAPGDYDRQKLVIQNLSANLVTFAAAGTSHVAAGVSATIPAADSRLFTWSAANSLWYGGV